MTRALALILLFDALVFGLAVPGMIIVSKVPVTTAALAAGGAALLAMLGAGLLRRPIGWYLAWLAHVAGILLGLLTPMMWVVGGIFATIWLLSFVLGRRLEATATLSA